MYTQFDEKGKIFTPVISKKPVAVTLQTVNNMIHGFIHIRPEERMKDSVVQEDRFIAVTDAEVFDHQHQVIYRTKFMAINLVHIVWITPDEEMAAPEE